MGWCCGEISMFMVTMLSPQLLPTATPAAASMALFPVPPKMSCDTKKPKMVKIQRTVISYQIRRDAP